MHSGMGILLRAKRGLLAVAVVVVGAMTTMGCGSADDGTLTTRYENAVAQTSWNERGDIHTVLVDVSTNNQLATMDWESGEGRLAWNVNDRITGVEPMPQAPNVGDMNRAIRQLHQAAWTDAAGNVHPSF